MESFIYLSIFSFARERERARKGRPRGQDTWMQVSSLTVGPPWAEDFD